MIRTELRLVSDKGNVSGIFPEAGILYQCVDVDGISLCDQPRGTAVSTFILTDRRILMAGFASEGGSGIVVRSLVKGQTVSVGLCTYRVMFSRRIAWSSKRVMIVIGAVCAALVAGVVMLRLFGVERSGGGVVQPVAAKIEAPMEHQTETERLDLLLKLDEGQGGAQIDEKIERTDTSSEAGSREAFQLYEQGLALLDAGKHSEAADKLAEAKVAAGRLPVVPAYMRMIDEAIVRARTAISEQRAVAVAEVRAFIGEASIASPGAALKIIASARKKLFSMPMNADDDLLRGMRDEIDRLQRSSVSVLLAKAHTLERLEGCRAAESEYREALEKYRSADRVLAQEIQSALDRCGSGGLR